MRNMQERLKAIEATFNALEEQASVVKSKLDSLEKQIAGTEEPPSIPLSVPVSIPSGDTPVDPVNRSRLLFWLVFAIIGIAIGFVVGRFSQSDSLPPAPVLVFELPSERREFLKENLERYHDHRNGGAAKDVAAEAFILNTSPIFQKLNDDEPQAESTDDRRQTTEFMMPPSSLFQMPEPPIREPSEPTKNPPSTVTEIQRDSTQPTARAPHRRGQFLRW
ncbi:MAG: hypothetical protein FWC43_12195 [Planctomycetaceae bacterium]|nr:hypothetical protein [Planctomycetaceae bacterium]